MRRRPDLLVILQNRFVVVPVLAIVIGGIAGCSSDPPPARLGPGMLALGTAKVTIDGTGAGTTQAVHCTPIGDLTTIITGDRASGVTAVVASAKDLSAMTVNITDVGGFTGSYNHGLSTKPATVHMTGRTYDITGTADGFTANNPSAKVPRTFDIQVAC
jgi:lipoprotein LpqH